MKEIKRGFEHEFTKLARIQYAEGVIEIQLQGWSGHDYAAVLCLSDFPPLTQSENRLFQALG